MIALVSNRDDLTCDWLVLELAARGLDFVRINGEDFPESSTIAWTEGAAELLAGKDSVSADTISSVWWRRSVAPRFSSATRTRPEIAWATGEAAAAWLGFWESVDARWVNHPLANARADNKLLQLRVARRLGLQVPKTLVTNDAARAAKFAQENGPIVCKALRSGLVPADNGEPGLLYTQLLDRGQLAALNELGPEPYLFQEHVEKSFELRVTVIGDQALACRIDSQETTRGEVDWRAAELSDLRHEPFRLPATVAEKLVALTHELGLTFGAHDLAVTPRGQYVLFEVNPNGQWAWVEQLTGLPLRSALTDELARGA